MARKATLSTPANPLAHKRAAFADNKKHIHPRISTSHSFRCRHYLLHTIEPWMHGARSPEIWLQHPCSTKHSSAFISLLDAVCQSRAQIYGRAASRQISLGFKVSARVLRVQLVHSCRQIHLHHRWYITSLRGLSCMQTCVWGPFTKDHWEISWINEPDGLCLSRTDGWGFLGAAIWQKYISGNPTH